MPIDRHMTSIAHPVSDRLVGFVRLDNVEVTGQEERQFSGSFPYPFQDQLGALNPRRLTEMVKMRVEMYERLLRNPVVKLRPSDDAWKSRVPTLAADNIRSR